MTQMKESLNLRNLPTLKSKNSQNKKSHTHTPKRICKKPGAITKGIIIYA